MRESPVGRIGRLPQFACQTLVVDGSTLRNVRFGLGTLVGRDELHASVAEHLGAHRLVTLTGVGGVGKTRLAVEVAATVASRFGDGVWLVDLAAVTDAAAVHDAIASTVGEFDSLSNSVLANLGQQSASLQYLQGQQSNFQALQLAAQKLTTSIQGADVPTVIVQLQEQQNQLQLTLAATAQVLQQANLLNFLKSEWKYELP